MYKLLISLLLFTLSGAYAQDTIPGLIPRFYSIEAATDLSLSPEIAHEQALKGLDLSLLEPGTDTNIWRPDRNTIPDHSLVKPDEVLKFVKELPSRSGQIRFTVLTADNRELIVILSKKVHTLLLRKNILAKLGYSTQPMTWVPRAKLEFKDTIDRDLLKEEMKDKLLAGTERWITSEENLSITLQDVLVLTSDSDIYNLATGIMLPEVHQGRRLLRAPYVPMAMVDATESINLMPWQAGRLVLNHLKFNHTQDLSTTFGTSWEDARWIGRKLAKLTRADFEEIVIKASFPEAVEKLLIEKIIARRNDLIELLQLGAETQKIDFDPEISFGDGLLNGEIVQEFFDGYAGRFSYGDPESPFSASELGSFALSRLQSQVLSTALEKFNKMLGTKDNENYIAQIGEIVKKEGPFFSTQAVAIPTFHGALIVSRDIVTGSYLGTNNKVQLVDNLGFALDAGVFGGIEGLPFPAGIKAGAGVSFARVYSHVKPVQSLKKSMKEPYKNMLVPLLLNKLGHKIDKLKTAQGEEGEALMQEVASDLKNTLAVGESFIITDSLMPRLFGEAEVSITQYFFLDKRLLQVYGRVQAERMMLSRFHLHRATENLIHVYQDYGKNLKLMLTVKLKSYVPLLAVSGRWNKASAETHFYPVSLHPRDVSVGTLKALRQSIFSLNHSALREVVTPHKVEHVISGRANTLQFMVFKRNRLGSDQGMRLTHAKGGKQKEIHRRYDATTTGTDFEGYAIEAVNSLISGLLKTDLALSQVQTINPGFTLGGKAKNKIFTSELEEGRLTTSFQRIFNGWRVRPKKLSSIIATLNKEAGTEVFDYLSVINTDSILLYQISFLYTMTQEGTDQLLNVSWERLWDIMSRHSVGDITNYTINHRTNRHFNRLYTLRSMLNSDPEEALKFYHSVLREIQEDITVVGLEELVGKDNLAYQGRIEGFRQGDENGDTPIFSHVYGELPLPLHVSPTQKVMQNWGILEGELMANWLMERAL
ncbi:MAG TPA: hypothetical protein VNJ08_13185 [Bacteriovoracaceae bacterium]|nr:hypothetical protein [Bacteriovoracaceae bacterium]